MIKFIVDFHGFPTAVLDSELISELIYCWAVWEGIVCKQWELHGAPAIINNPKSWSFALAPNCWLACGMGPRHSQIVPWIASDQPWPRHCVSCPSLTKSSMSYTANLPPVCSVAAGNSRSQGLETALIYRPSLRKKSHQTRRFTIAMMKKRLSKHILPTTCRLLSSGSDGSVHGGRLKFKGLT